MRIAHRHLNFFVAHEFRNSSQIHSRHDQPAREVVANVMPGEIEDAGSGGRARTLKQEKVSIEESRRSGKICPTSPIDVVPISLRTM
jgi:hypothetical protein